MDQFLHQQYSFTSNHIKQTKTLPFPSLLEIVHITLRKPCITRAPACPGFGMVGLSHLPNRSASDEANEAPQEESKRWPKDTKGVTSLLWFKWPWIKGGFLTDILSWGILFWKDPKWVLRQKLGQKKLDKTMFAFVVLCFDLHLTCSW